MKRLWVLSIATLAIIPAIFHLHLLEKDFLEIFASSDGWFTGHGYCFLKLNNYAGITELSGFQGRPPLLPLLQNLFFNIIGHNLLSIYLLYSIPRLLILPVFYLICRKYFSSILAFLTTSTVVFFPFWETYALSTLKADVFIVFWSLLAFWFFLLWKEKQNSVYLLFSSASLCLSVLTKETALGFAAVLWLIEIVYIIKLENKKQLIWIFLPPFTLITPFMVFSFFSVGRIFPSIYASQPQIYPFFRNYLTYIFSTVYYMGINFDLNRIITFESTIRLIFILSGMFYAINHKRWELILPVLGFLAAICFQPIAVIQADIVGNREILHRIALVVPFMALLIALGTLNLASYLKMFNSRQRQFFIIVVMFFVSTGYIFRYFRAPYALDYTDTEYYVNAFTVAGFHPEIPVSEFRMEKGLCVVKNVPLRQFLHETYLPYKTSAFPKYYQELLTGAWIIGLLGLVLFNKKSSNSVGFCD